MSLSEFNEGVGCISVEWSARVLAEINMKERMDWYRSCADRRQVLLKQ